MAFTKVATVEDVPAGHGKQVTINGRTLALFNVDGTYYALDDTCPHRGGPLSEGAVAGAEVICPWHSARFDLKTGQVLGPPAKSAVKSYAVRVTGNEIEVDVV